MPRFITVILCTSVISGLVIGPGFAADSTTSYLQTLAQQLHEYYFPVPGTTTNTAVVSFTLSCDGYTSDTSVVKSPARDAGQSEPASRALHVAVRNASPFAKPPPALHCPIRLTATFSDNGSGKFPLACSVLQEGTSVAGVAGGETH